MSGPIGIGRVAGGFGAASAARMTDVRSYDGPSPNSIILLGVCGNSNTGAWLAGSSPETLVANPNVLYFQNSAPNSLSATWQVADVNGALYTPPLETRFTGYHKGQIAAPSLIAANRLQKIYGGLVCVVDVSRGGGPTVLVNPARGNTDAYYDFNEPSETGQNNNMWYWFSTMMNSAIASIQAGTLGMPRAHPTLKYANIIISTTSHADMVYTSPFLGALYTTSDTNTNIPTNMQAFITAAETVSGIGGYAKAEHTHWMSIQAPKGSALDSTIFTSFGTSQGDFLLDQATRSRHSLVRTPNGLQTANAQIPGTVDGAHYNSAAQTVIGNRIASLYTGFGNPTVTG